MKKILIVRFSSIGDIVLTTPVIRCLKQQFKEEVQIDFLTKKQFSSLIEPNPHISNVITIENSIKEVLNVLKTNNYNFIIDLHKNVRTRGLKSKLGVKTFDFPKLNWQKWLLTTFKINKMPKLHIVDRYFEAVKELGIVNDEKGIDFFMHSADKVDVKQEYNLDNFVAVAVGAQFATKRMPLNKIVETLRPVLSPIILLGGPTDELLGEEIKKALPGKIILSLCGKLSLGKSASVLKQANVLLTHDTGLMHIASAFNIPIVSVWGNTVPELGMYAYTPQNPDLVTIFEVKNLKCRPCSKIGFKTCPKKHFNCMNMHNAKAIAQKISENTLN